MERSEAGWETPTIEVCVFRDGELLHRELCESEAEVDSTVEFWSDLDNVTFQVDDLSYHHQPGQVLEPTPPLPADPSDGPTSGGPGQAEG